MSKILVSAIGSSGDLFPMVGLATELQRRGMEVRLIANPHYRKVVEKFGLQFLAAGSAEKLTSCFRDPRICHPRKGLHIGFQTLTLPAMGDVFRHVERHRDEADLLIGGEYDFGLQVASEKFDLPLVSVALTPDKFRSTIKNAKLPWPMLAHWHRGPRWWKKWQFWMMDRLFADPLLSKPVNSFRSSVGLKPVRSLAYRWVKLSRLILAMFPDWYAAAQQDWPVQTLQTGFPFLPQGSQQLDPSVTEFVERGDPPVVFTPGSYNLHSRGLTEVCVEACKKLNCRLVVVGGESGFDQMEDQIMQVPFAPFESLFKRAAAVVHHAGIGTTSLGMRAGVPQLLIPGPFSSGDTARRATRLGTSLSLSRRHLRATAIANTLSELLSNPEFSERSQALARSLADTVDPFRLAADKIEELVCVNKKLTKMK